MTAGRVVRLTERRPAVRRVPRADVADLLRDFPRLIDVAPTTERGRYRLTPRGAVGSFRTSGRVWEIAPKFGWESVRHLLGTGAELNATGEPPGPGDKVVSAYALRLAGLMTERAVAGLVRGYAERATRSDTVRGRIDLPRQLRDRGEAAGPFHLIADEFTTDVVWNQVAVSAAARLASVPGLDPAARTALGRALALFPDVTRRSFAAGELDAIPFDPRTEPYRPLVDWCRALLAGHGDTFLLNLEHLFQAHVTGLLPGRARSGRTALPNEPVALADPTGHSPSLTLIPDVTVRDAGGTPLAVWDVKWKHLGPGGPDPADLHQVLGYAAALGVPFAGLVYPGRRFSARVYAAAAGVRVAVVTHRVTGPAAWHAASARRAARAVLRPDRFFGP